MHMANELLSVPVAAALADRVVLMDNGCIIVDGDTKKIMSDSELMTEHGLEVPDNI